MADDQTGANVLWNETRPGSQELYFARVNPDQTRLTATAGADGTISVSGHAGFRAPSAAAASLIAEDGTGDAPGGVQETGIDLTGAKLYQPDPYTPRLAFEWRAAKLVPPRGQAPEVNQYLWYFGVGEGEAPTVFQLVAKLSNVASTGTPGNPSAFAGHAGASFQLRGNCGPTPVGPVTLNDCQHLAWLQGHFDVTNGVVRVFVPLSSAAAPLIAPGAVIRATSFSDFDIQASHVVVASSNTTADLVVWEDELTYTVGNGEASIGSAPAGTPSEEVAFTPVTLDAGGSFSATVPATGDTVYLKTCFDGRCDVTTTAVA